MKGATIVPAEREVSPGRRVAAFFTPSIFTFIEFALVELVSGGNLRRRIAVHVKNIVPEGTALAAAR